MNVGFGKITALLEIRVKKTEVFSQIEKFSALFFIGCTVTNGLNSVFGGFEIHRVVVTHGIGDNPDMERI